MWFPNRVRQRSHAFILAACGFCAVGLCLLLNLIWPSLFEVIELRTVDQRFLARPWIAVSTNRELEKSEELVMIDYDDAAADKHGLGRWPWDRRVHAELIDWLTNAGARMVVLDLLFNHRTRDPKEDSRLAQSTARAGNVVYPFVFQPVREDKAGDVSREFASAHILQGRVTGSGEIPGVGALILPIPELTARAFALGHILRTPDIDGVLRRVPMIYAIKGGFVPALALSAAFKDLQVDPASLIVERGRAIRFKTRAEEEIVVPIDKEGRAWINYAGPWATRFVHYPYSWLLDQFPSLAVGKEAVQRFKNKLVIVANLTIGSGDQGATPFERDMPLGEVHLHLLNMLQTRQFLASATWSQSAASIAVPNLILIAASLAGGATLILSVFVVIFGAYLYVLQHAFNAGLILPYTIPALSMTVSLILLLCARFLIVDRDRRRIQEILDRYLPVGTKRQIRRNPHRIEELLAARTRELTIMFADIEGFSAFCKDTHPKKVQDVLRKYLSTFTDIVRAHGGTLDKYLGDGLLAFFGDADPELADDIGREKDIERQAANAVLAGIHMQRAMIELNRAWKFNGEEEHRARIGINTGYVTVGNLGTEHVWAYTVVGNEVNKAQRLESKCQPGGLLLGKKTYALARSQNVIDFDIEPTAEEIHGFGVVRDLYRISPEMVGRLGRAPGGAIASRGLE
jgi:adenylate cyclase